MLAVRAGFTWHPHQWAAISWRPEACDGEVPIELAAILGQYGSGKTACAAGRFLSIALACPYVPGIHSEDDHPMSAIVAPTMAGLHQGALRELMRVCPEQLILRRRLYGIHQDVLLANGHLIKLYAATGAIEGPTLCQLWADEIQHQAYATRWHNLQARVRDGRSPRLSVIVSGIAQHGHVEDLFRAPKLRTARTFLSRTAQNTTLAPAVASALAATLSADDLRLDPDGWVPRRDTYWPSWDQAWHLSRSPSLEEVRALPVSVGVDLSRHGAVVVAVPWPASDGSPGLLAVDQVLTDATSAEDVSAATERLGWRWDSGSAICVDPTASLDEVNAWKRRFPRARLVQYGKASPYYNADTGLRAIARALRDGSGVTRLWVHPRLLGRSPRGVPESVRGYSASAPKDDFFEHTADALRYLVAHAIPLPDHRSVYAAGVGVPRA